MAPFDTEKLRRDIEHLSPENRRIFFETLFESSMRDMRERDIAYDRALNEILPGVLHWHRTADVATICITGDQTMTVKLGSLLDIVVRMNEKIREFERRLTARRSEFDLEEDIPPEGTDETPS